MYWLFTAVVLVALALVLFGAMSVWIIVLLLALKMGLAALVVIALYALWQRYLRSKSCNR